MSSILDLLQGPMGQQIINGVSKQANQPADKTSNLLSMALPVLMGAMKKNASTPEGAQGLMGALNNHQGGILNNLGGLFDGGVDESVKQDGQGILGHLLGNKQPVVENALSKESGVDTGSVSEILKMAAPLVMGLVGQKKQQAGISDTNGLGSLLGGLLGSNSGGTAGNQSVLMSLLDADGDGSVIDDVAGMVMGGNKKKGGLGGMLGGLFGK